MNQQLTPSHRQNIRNLLEMTIEIIQNIIIDIDHLPVRHLQTIIIENHLTRKMTNHPILVVLQNEMNIIRIGIILHVVIIFIVQISFS